MSLSRLVRFIMVETEYQDSPIRTSQTLATADVLWFGEMEVAGCIDARLLIVGNDPIPCKYAGSKPAGNKLPCFSQLGPEPIGFRLPLPHQLPKSGRVVQMHGMTDFVN